MHRKQTIIFLSIILSLSWYVFSGFSCNTPKVFADSRVADLERKIADLSLLNQQLKDRMDQAQAIRTALAEQQEQLVSEIKVLVKTLQIKNFRRAMQELRIRYNIDLLRTTVTYMDKLDDKMNFYQTGRDRLSYLQSLAEDDIRMIATLNELKTDALTTQISLVINRYLPDAHTIQIDPERVNLVSDQQVWKRLIEGNL